MQKIVTLTMNPTLDKSASIDYVVSERKLRCDSVQYEPGGGGINVSRAIKNLHGTSQAFYLAGGPIGEILERLIAEEGLDHHKISINGWSREGLKVSETSTGQQYRFNLPAPTVTAEEWQQTLDAMAALDPLPDYVVASGSLPDGVPTDFFARLARWTQKAGCRLILDSSTVDAMQLALEEGVYLIKPNLREFRHLVNSRLTQEDEQEAAIMKVVEQGQSQIVVVSLGAAGVLWATRQTRERLRAPTVSIKSKVGAGDSMVAGLVLSLAQGKNVRDAVMFGVAAGAAAVTTPGTELCRSDDTQQLYKTMQKQ